MKKNSHLKISVSVLSECEGQISNLGIISNKDKKEQDKDVLQLLMIKHDPDATSKDTLFEIKSKNVKKSTSKKLSTIKNFKHLQDVRQQHHFFKIKNIRGFLNNRARNLHGRNYNCKNYYCEKCFLQFTSKNKCLKHMETCNDNQRTLYPQPNSKISFSNHRYKFKAPVIGFCDFESVLQRIKERATCHLCSKSECLCSFPTSDDINIHKAVGYSILFVDSENVVFLQDEYVGEDAVKHFFKKLSDYEKSVEMKKQAFREVKKVKATAKDWKSFNMSTVCHICEEKFDETSIKLRKVMDHDHVTGKMVGAAHSICNLTRTGPFYTPIFFHNAQG